MPKTDAKVAKAVARGGVRSSQMTLQQIVDSMKGGVCPRSLKKVAAEGKYQIMHFNIKAYIGKNPQNKLFSPEMQVKIMNNHLFFGGNGKIWLRVVAIQSKSKIIFQANICHKSSKWQMSNPQ